MIPYVLLSIPQISKKISTIIHPFSANENATHVYGFIYLALISMVFYMYHLGDSMMLSQILYYIK